MEKKEVERGGAAQQAASSKQQEQEQQEQLRNSMSDMGSRRTRILHPLKRSSQHTERNLRYCTL